MVYIHQGLTIRCAIRRFLLSQSDAIALGDPLEPVLVEIGRRVPRP